MGGTYRMDEEMRNAYKILVRTPEGMRPFGKLGRKREDNINRYHKE
jgi:hypothetical protein